MLTLQHSFGLNFGAFYPKIDFLDSTIFCKTRIYLFLINFSGINGVFGLKKLSAKEV